MARGDSRTAAVRRRQATVAVPSTTCPPCHETTPPASLAASLRAQVVSATLDQTESWDAAVSYSIELACGPRRWKIERRFSEFARLHSDLGHDAPTADIFALTHIHGRVLGFITARRCQPELIEARLAALNEWLALACTALEFDSRLGRFLAVPCAEIDAFRDWAQRREGASEPRPCVLCSAGVPCEFSEEARLATLYAASALRPLRKNYLLRTLSQYLHCALAENIAAPHSTFLAPSLPAGKRRTPGRGACAA